MKLWLLRPVKTLPSDDNPWEPWYDKTFGFVVRGETEEDARAFAHENAEGENSEDDAKTAEPWLDSNYSTCVELLPDGEPGIVLRDFWSA